MIVWVWRDCEPLPIDRNDPRLMRAGLLCRSLRERGHEVRWFNSTFDHYQKRFREKEAGTHVLPDGVRVELVRGLGYSSNGSPRRLLHNAIVARRFLARARLIATQEGEVPDLIVADLPMPDSALASVRLAREWNIPSVVSVRDLWPDFFANFLSPAKMFLAHPFIANLDKMVKAACQGADHLVGISDGYLDWALGKAGRERSEKDAVVPLGYAPPELDDDSEQAKTSLRSKGVDFDSDLITFIGSWGRTYDLEMLLEAAKLLADETGLQFVIAGKGEQQKRFEKAANNLRNIVLPGWLDRHEISVLLNHSSVALGPYSKDAPQGLPNKLFEYLAAGVFQVTTLGSEAYEALKRSGGGVTVPGGDPAAFANGIRHARLVGGSSEKKAAIKEYFRQNFDASNVYAEYVAKLEGFAEAKTA